MTRWAILGGLIGATAVTAVGVYAKVRELQSPEFSAQAQARATAAANAALANTYGLTPERMRQFQAIATRFHTA